MIKKEFLKPNRSKLKIFITIALIAGIFLAVTVNAMGKSFASGLLGGSSTKSYETVAMIFSFAFFLPTLIIWGITYSFIKILGIIIGFVVNLYCWYLISCSIYLWSEKRKKTPAP